MGEVEDIQQRLNETLAEKEMLEKLGYDSMIDPNKPVISTTDYPDLALEFEYVNTPGAKKILQDIARYERDHTLTKTTCNVLRSIVNRLDNHDFPLSTMEGNMPNQMRCQFWNDMIIASCGVPREDRDTMEYIELVKSIKFQFELELSRAVPDSTGFNERSRKHIKIGESRHTLSNGQSGMTKRRRGPLSFLLNRGNKQEGEYQ